MSLNEEIQQLLNSYSLPADVGRQMGEAMARVDANRVAPGLEVGERAPDSRLPNAADQDVSLEERLSQGPVVLTFYRGAWCPVCNLQLLALQRALPDLRSLGASVIAVAPDDSEPTPDNARVDFDLLTDADQSVIRAYRLHAQAPSGPFVIVSGEHEDRVPGGFEFRSVQGEGNSSLLSIDWMRAESPTVARIQGAASLWAPKAGELAQAIRSYCSEYPSVRGKRSGNLRTLLSVDLKSD